VAYKSNLAAVQAQMNRARDAGLIAAAQVVANRVKEKLAGGFTSGLFVTGNLLNSVTRTEPTDENGVRVIRVGTNVVYALPWELGHINLFSRKFERQERWLPALMETAQQQADAYARVYARFIGQQQVSEAAD
jgi:hypothetical protein